MAFVAKEAAIEIGPLTVVSTHAAIDQPKGASRNDLLALIRQCEVALMAKSAA